MNIAGKKKKNVPEQNMLLLSRFLFFSNYFIHASLTFRAKKTFYFHTSFIEAIIFKIQTIIFAANI
jgi:hypothetical protein